MVGADDRIVCLGIEHGSHHQPFSRHHAGGERTRVSGKGIECLYTGNDGQHARWGIDHWLYH